MSQTTIVKLIDDLDGSEHDPANGIDVEKVRFALQGKGYEIDLNLDNNARLNEALAPFIAAARPTNVAYGVGRPRTTRSGTSGRTKRIREWWKQQSPENYSARGRLPLELVTAYNEAHPEDRA